MRMEDSQSNASASDDGRSPNFLPLYFYDFTPKLKHQAEKELSEDVDFPEKHVEKLRNLIGDPAGSAYSIEELMIFLRIAKHDVHKAYATFKKHNAIFTKYDSLFKNFNFQSIHKPIQTNTLNLMPRRDVDGCIILVCLPQNWDSSYFMPSDTLRTCIVAMLDILRCPITQITGIKAVVDFSGLTIRKMTTISPWMVKFCAEIMEKGLPVRLKEYHILNHGKFFDWIWAIGSHFLSTKIIQRAHLHGRDLKNLHKYIPPTLLPKEIGGLVDLQETREWINELEKSESYITAYIDRAKRTEYE